MRLIHTDCNGDTHEVSIGYKFGHGPDEYTVTWMPKPHKPSSSGKVNVMYTNEQGNECEPELYAHVLDMEWIEREDQGWEHPEVHMARVFAIIKKNTGEDVSGYNLDTAIAGIRQILISDKRYTADELRYIKDWLNEQELPEMLKPQSGL